MSSGSRIRLFLAAALLLIGVAAGYQLGLAQDQDQETGARLYAENCAVCHGIDGQGRIGATLAKDWPSIRPDLTVRNVIVNGVPGSLMPAWSETQGGPLSEVQIDAITEYILSWETGGVRPILPLPTPRSRPALTPPPEVKGDPNRGAALYDQNCLVCHGPDGEGRVGATLARNWPPIRSDLRIRASIAGGIENSLMPAWSQAQGGPLSETDIDDLTAFIFTLETLGSVDPQPTQDQFQPSWLVGWGGVLLAIVLFGIIVVLALLWQASTAK